MTLHTLAVFGLFWFAFTSVAFGLLGAWASYRLLLAATWLERGFLSAVIVLYGGLFLVSGRTLALCWGLV